MNIRTSLILFVQLAIKKLLLSGEKISDPFKPYLLKDYKPPLLWRKYFIKHQFFANCALATITTSSPSIAAGVEVDIPKSVRLIVPLILNPAKVFLLIGCVP